MGVGYVCEPNLGGRHRRIRNSRPSSAAHTLLPAWVIHKTLPLKINNKDRPLPQKHVGDITLWWSATRWRKAEELDSLLQNQRATVLRKNMGTNCPMRCYSRCI